MQRLERLPASNIMGALQVCAGNVFWSFFLSLWKPRCVAGSWINSRGKRGLDGFSCAACVQAWLQSDSGRGIIWHWASGQVRLQILAVPIDVFNSPHHCVGFLFVALHLAASSFSSSVASSSSTILRDLSHNNSSHTTHLSHKSSQLNSHKSSHQTNLTSSNTSL